MAHVLRASARQAIGTRLLRALRGSREHGSGLARHSWRSAAAFSEDRSYNFSALPSNRATLLRPSYLGSVPSHAGGFQCKRTMFIETQSTPNPASLMFLAGRSVMETGSRDFENARAAMASPLALALFQIDGVTRVFFGSDFVTVTKRNDVSWAALKPQVFAAIMDFFTSGASLFQDGGHDLGASISEDDSEVVAMIKELLETRIRPAVQEDGGDIAYCGFDEESGILRVKMQGACSGCPSSTVTLKSGIENMLMHYVPEVKEVVQEMEDEDDEE